MFYFQIPEEWIADDRCILCKYSKRSYPKLCRCYDCVSSTTDYYALGRRAEAAILQQYGRPVPPLRTGSLTRGKNKKVLPIILKSHILSLNYRKCLLFKMFATLFLRDPFKYMYMFVHRLNLTVAIRLHFVQFIAGPPSTSSSHT